MHVYAVVWWGWGWSGSVGGCCASSALCPWGVAHARGVVLLVLGLLGTRGRPRVPGRNALGGPPPRPPHTPARLHLFFFVAGQQALTRATWRRARWRGVEGAAVRLVQEAVNRGSADNVAAAVVQVRLGLGLGLGQGQGMGCPWLHHVIRHGK